jgi:two-component system, cell cycle sensor histidine kinase and response regulator CckA
MSDEPRDPDPPTTSDAEPLYRTMFESARDAIFTMRADRFIDCNPATTEIFDCTREQIIGQPPWRFSPPRQPDDRDSREAALERIHAALDGEPQLFEWRHMRYNGTPFDAEVSLNRVEVGDETFIQAVVRDISARKMAERSLHDSERLYRTLLDNLPVGVALTRFDGDLVGANDAAFRLLGLPSARIENLRTPSLWAEPGRRDEILEELREHGSLREREVRLVRSDGTFFTAELNLETFPLGEEEVVLTVFQDVTDRREAEQALRESEAKHRSLAEQSLQGLVVAQGQPPGIVYANPAACDIMGMTHEEVLALRATSLTGRVHPDDRSRFLERYSIRLGDSSSPPAPLEVRLRRGDDVMRWLQMVGSYIRYRGEPAVQVAFTDVTDRRWAEAERERMTRRTFRAQKLESLGVMAGGIAHDFNNLLTGILGSAELALFELPRSSAVKKTVERIHKSASRAAELAEKMLIYSGKRQLDLEPVHLEEIVRESSRLLESSIPSRSSLALELAEEVPPVLGDASQLSTAVLNLITNAAESLDEKGGTIAVRVNTRGYTRERLEALNPDTRLAPGRYLVLEVSDDGPGMDEQTLARIFDPFFTTKFTGRGLGLAAVQGIVRSHRGAIEVQSSPGSGTSFRLLLPVSGGDDDDRENENAREDERKRGLAVVAVDDAPVESALEQMLRHLGYETLRLSSGARSLRQLKRRADELRLLMLDSTIESEQSQKLLDAVDEIDSRLPLVRIAAPGDEKPPASSREGRPAVSLTKPFGLSDLREAVHSVAPSSGERG